jgi:hypothetical protein
MREHLAKRKTLTLDRILSAAGDYQKYELSKLILHHIENFLLSPDHYRSWAPEKSARIISAFRETIIGRMNVPDHPDLMLF